MAGRHEGRFWAQAADRLEGTVELLGRLVAEPSVQGSGTAAARCLDIVAEQVAGFARTYERVEHGGVPSLLASFGDAEPAGRLLFSGHVDVVPADERDWSAPPFELHHRDGRLYGRGTCDMKGGVAAFVAALGIVRESGGLEAGGVDLLLTSDEEIGSERGTIPLLDSGRVSAGAAICGEPTGLAVFLGNRGLVWVRVVVRGRGGHAGLSHDLRSPVPSAARIVAALHDLELQAKDERFDPPHASLNVTGVDAGAALDAPNVIPDTVRITVDRRLLPGEDPDDATAAIDAIVRAHLDDGCTAEVTVLRRWPPCMIDVGDPIAVAATAAVGTTGRPVRVGADLAANDSSWLDAAGIPTVLLGPGDPGQAHVSDEHVDVDDLRDATQVYAELVHARAQGAAQRDGRVPDGEGERE